MSVFQNPHMAGRGGFGVGGSQPRMRGGTTNKDMFGDGVRQAIQQPSGMQMAPARQSFSAYDPTQMATSRQAFSAYSPQQGQPMAQARQDYAAYMQQPQQASAQPQTPPAAPQRPQRTSQDITQSTPASMNEYAKQYNSFAPQQGNGVQPGAPIPSNGPLRPEFAAPQGRPRPTQYVNQPLPGSGNWMNDPNQRAAVGMGSGTIRPGELIM